MGNTCFLSLWTSQAGKYDKWKSSSTGVFPKEQARHCWALACHYLYGIGLGSSWPQVLFPSGNLSGISRESIYKYIYIFFLNPLFLHNTAIISLTTPYGNHLIWSASPQNSLKTVESWSQGLYFSSLYPCHLCMVHADPCRHSIKVSWTDPHLRKKWKELSNVLAGLHGINSKHIDTWCKGLYFSIFICNFDFKKAVFHFLKET